MIRDRVWAALVLAALFGLVVYRAATQSLVHDEAFTYQLYLAGPVSNIFRVFDANLHFLAVLAMRLSTVLFGFSEFAIRLPSVLACGWYFVTVYRMCPRSPLAVLLMAANPLVLDLLVAARGYSLALALLAYATYAIDRPLRAGIAAGLAIAANLTFGIPVLVLGLVMAAQRRKWLEFAAPVAAIAVVLIVASPLLHAHRQDFYYGTPSLWTSGRVLAALSLAHNTGLGGWNREFAWSPWWRDFVMLAVAAIVVGRARADRAAAVAAGSVAILVLAHYAVGLLYPLDRTGVYLLPLAGLALAGSRWRPSLILGCVIAAVYVMQVEWRSFYVWRYDADTKALVRALAAEPHANPVRLGASWPLEPSLNYYRETMHLTWLEPVTRGGPAGDFDYYALTEAEAAGDLEVVYRGEVSGTFLGRKRKSSSRFSPSAAAPEARPAAPVPDTLPSDK